MQKEPRARIADKEQWGAYFLLSLESRAIASRAHPGQFLMVRVTEQNFPLLRRPFSIHARGRNTVDVFFQTTGLGTSLLSRKAVDETLDILGPLGQGFSLEDEFKSKHVDLIGGGRGIAPLYFLAQELLRRGAAVRVFYGGQSRKDLPLRSKFQEGNFPVLCATDDGSYGFQGLVTELYTTEAAKKTPHFIFACGPEAMLERIGQICRTKDIPAEFSLESIMGCGFGACWGCVKKIRSEGGKEWQKICEKGPVFYAGDIVWPSEDR
ncbi:MAG: dihydroorotate dehydrogenase electron transfer subunit [Candidatus Aminicenantes bacterium]|jgi:dihydroorotate dehydrogenase electron transfer subunit